VFIWAGIEQWWAYGFDGVAWRCRNNGDWYVRPGSFVRYVLRNIGDDASKRTGASRSHKGCRMKALCGIGVASIFGPSSCGGRCGSLSSSSITGLNSLTWADGSAAAGWRGGWRVATSSLAGVCVEENRPRRGQRGASMNVYVGDVSGIPSKPGGAWKGGGVCGGMKTVAGVGRQCKICEGYAIVQAEPAIIHSVPATIQPVLLCSAFIYRHH